MFCQHCGKEMDEFAPVCPHCQKEQDALIETNAFKDLMTMDQLPTANNAMQFNERQAQLLEKNTRENERMIEEMKKNRTVLWIIEATVAVIAVILLVGLFNIMNVKSSLDTISKNIDSSNSSSNISNSNSDITEASGDISEQVNSIQEEISVIRNKITDLTAKEFAEIDDEDVCRRSGGNWVQGYVCLPEDSE